MFTAQTCKMKSPRAFEQIQMGVCGKNMKQAYGEGSFLLFMNSELFQIAFY